MRGTGHAEELGWCVGRRIVAVRALNDVEVASEGWEPEDAGASVALILDDGRALISWSDPEGSGPGHLRRGKVVGWGEPGASKES